QALREVTEELTVRRIDLLGVEADVVRDADQLVHQGAGLIEAALARKGVHEPERAREERAFLPADAVFAEVAVDERAGTQLALDRGNRPSQPLALRLVIGQDRERQQARV